MKKVYYISLFCNLIFLSGCNFFESKIQDSFTAEKPSFLLDTAMYFTKSIIENSEIEKVKVIKSTPLFMEDYNSNLSNNFSFFFTDTCRTYSSIRLNNLGISADSAIITFGNPLSKVTFYIQENNLLFDVQKVVFLTLDEHKIYSKNIKLTQRLLNSEKQCYEVNYNYFY